MAVRFANNFSSKLKTSIGSSNTTIEVNDASGFPDISNIDDWAPLTIFDAQDNIEIVHVTSISGTTLTVDRGQENTIALSWSGGVSVEIRDTEESLSALREDAKNHADAITSNSTNWDTAYQRSVTDITGSGNGTLTVTRQGTDVTADLSHSHTNRNELPSAIAYEDEDVSFTQSVVIGSPTGGSFANGSLNVEEIRVNGVLVVDENRSITTGDGIQGGGNLSSDRTISVDSTVLRDSDKASQSGDLAEINGDYTTLRARATTKDDVDLGNVPNEDATNPSNLDQAGATTDQALVWNGTSWVPQNITIPIDSVAGKTGTVTVDKTDVGLGNVENKALSTSTWNDLGISKTDVSSSDVDLGNVSNEVQVVDAGNAVSIQVDISTNLPVAGTAGRFYVETDGNQRILYDNGTNWIEKGRNPVQIGTTDLSFDPATQTELNNHTTDTTNPHSVNAAQIGLNNVPNEDATNPVNWDYGLTGSDTNIVTGTSGTSGNISIWNVDGDLVDSGSKTSDFLTSVTASDIGLENVPNEDATNMANWDQSGAANGQAPVWNGTQWVPQGVTVPVDSVAGKTGDVVLDKTDVGLDKVPNLDATKPKFLDQDGANEGDTLKWDGLRWVTAPKDRLIDGGSATTDFSNLINPPIILGDPNARIEELSLSNSGVVNEISVKDVEIKLGSPNVTKEQLSLSNSGVVNEISVKDAVVNLGSPNVTKEQLSLSNSGSVNEISVKDAVVNLDTNNGLNKENLTLSVSGTVNSITVG